MIDDNEDLLCIEVPVATNVMTPRPVARNGGAVGARVHFNGKGSKSRLVKVRLVKEHELLVS